MTTTTNILYANVRLGSIISCTSKDELRYGPSGVEVRRHPDEGVFLSATDGRMLAIVHDEQATARKDAGPYIIPRAILPTTIPDKANALLSLKDAKWNLVDSKGKKAPRTTPVDPIRSFPPAHNIIPDLDDGEERHGISLDIEKLKALADAIGRDVDGNVGTHLTIWVGKNNRPVVCVGRKGTIGVLSPLQSKPEGFATELAETRKAYQRGLV